MHVKSRSLTDEGINLIIELRSNKCSELVTAIKELQSVKSASLLEHDGEVTF